MNKWLSTDSQIKSKQKRILSNVRFCSRTSGLFATTNKWFQSTDNQQIRLAIDRTDWPSIEQIGY